MGHENTTNETPLHNQSLFLSDEDKNIINNNQIIE